MNNDSFIEELKRLAGRFDAASEKYPDLLYAVSIGLGIWLNLELEPAKKELGQLGWELAQLYQLWDNGDKVVNIVSQRAGKFSNQSPTDRCWHSYFICTSTADAAASGFVRFGQLAEETLPLIKRSGVVPFDPWDQERLLREAKSHCWATGMMLAASSRQVHGFMPWVAHRRSESASNEADKLVLVGPQARRHFTDRQKNSLLRQHIKSADIYMLPEGDVFSASAQVLRSLAAEASGTSEQTPTDETPPKPRKKRGRPPRTEDAKQKDKRMVQDWEAAKGNGTRTHAELEEAREWDRGSIRAAQDRLKQDRNRSDHRGTK